MKNPYTTKVRILILAVFALSIIYQIRDVFIQNIEISILTFIVAPIAIYYFTMFLWSRRNT